MFKGDEIIMSEKNEALTEQEKLRYLQTKIHEAVLECINTYILFRNATPLIDSSTAYLFMDFMLIMLFHQS